MSLKASLQAQLQVIANQIAELSRLPEDNPLNEGDVLIVQRTFTGSDKVYTYTLVYANEVFWASGNNREGKSLALRSWNNVLTWLSDRCVSMRHIRADEGTELLKS